jgi:hypothetical protein
MLGIYVGKNNNIIEINGKRYNAKTGEPLSHPAASSVTAHPAKKPLSDVVRPAPKHASKHRTAPSRTLMRHAVKKPSAQPKTAFKAQGHTDTLIKPPMGEVIVNSSAKRVDPNRLQKAKRVPKSRLIQHFTDVTPAVTLVPTSLPARPPLSAPPAAAASPKPRTTADLLEHALKHASSHTEKAPRVHKAGHARRKAGIGAGAALAVVMLFVISSQSLSSLKLQMASAKAGFNAELPDYQPAGYSMEKLTYSEGVVATKFGSNSDERAYTLTQKKADWDSRALRDLFVTPADKNYQTVQAGGRTIFLYGDHNATWVNGGIWYQLQTNGSLSNKQLVDLASSL